eukprot:990875-Pyramimonas_sp.AAC.1
MDGSSASFFVLRILAGTCGRGLNKDRGGGEFKKVEGSGGVGGSFGHGWTPVGLKADYTLKGTHGT